MNTPSASFHWIKTWRLRYRDQAEDVVVVTPHKVFPMKIRVMPDSDDRGRVIVPLIHLTVGKKKERKANPSESGWNRAEEKRKGS